MSKLQNKTLKIWRQPTKFRLSRIMLKKVKKPGRHSKKFFLNISSRRKLVISLRQFKTNKKTRSKKKNQLVVPFGMLAVKEIAICYTVYKKSILKNSSLFSPLLPKAQILSFLFIALGISGSIYFAGNIGATNNPPPVFNRTAVSQNLLMAAPEPIYVLSRAEPTKVNIPSVGISSDITPVGLNADQSLLVPGSPWQVGWYSGSPTPGELGPSVLVGHVDSQDGPAVFWRLAKLKSGDVIEISRADGSLVKFMIDEVAQFPQDSFPTDRVYGDLNYAGVRLITCGGIFNSETRHYSHNTVVFGTLIDKSTY